VPTLAKGKRITGSDRDKLAKDLKKQYQAGASIRELANETGRSYGFIHRLLSDSGVKLRGRGGATRGKSAGKR
jgi:predicted transcriptional regulator